MIERKQSIFRLTVACIALMLGATAIGADSPPSTPKQVVPAYQLPVNTRLWVTGGTGDVNSSGVPLYSKLEDAQSTGQFGTDPAKTLAVPFQPGRDYSFEIIEVVPGPAIGSPESYFSNAKPWLYKVKLDDGNMYYASEAKVNQFLVKVTSNDIPKKFSKKTSLKEQEAYLALVVPMINLNQKTSAVITTEQPLPFFERARAWFAWADKKSDKRKPAKEGVRIGMSKEDVLASNWGKPQYINKTTSAGGTHEQWVYGANYLYFENGVLTTIQN